MIVEQAERFKGFNRSKEGAEGGEFKRTIKYTMETK